jgi:hypothetical protein
MSHADTLESYMLRMELPHEQVNDDTWVLAPNSLRHARIIVRIDDPIVLYSTPLFSVTEATPDRETLYRRLLEFNDTLLHCAYALDDSQIVLSGAQQIEDLDFGEFQAMVEDMSMALDSHLEQLIAWRPATVQEGN